MGNWRTVNMIGQISRQSEVDALRAYLDFSRRGWIARSIPMGPLSFSTSFPGLCGMNDWPALSIRRAGNLAERNYSVKNVADQLAEILPLAPTLLLQVHCGADWESDKCIATVSVGEGLVAAGPPQIATLTGPTEEQILRNFAINMLRPQ